MEKKTTRIKLTIPEPCHERWDQMTPTEKGAFCQSCEKEVMDFSGLQREDIAYYFKYKNTGKTCGRFKPEQLQQTYLIPPDPEPKRSWMRAIWLLPLTLFSKNVFGQQKPPVCDRPQTETQAPAAIDTTIKPVYDEVILTGDTIVMELPQQQNLLQGRVLNNFTGAALPLAIVKVNDSLQTVTDSSGNFVLDLPEGFAADSFVVTLEGFSGKYIPLKNDSVMAFREIKLAPLFEWKFDAPESTLLSPVFCTTAGWTVATYGFTVPEMVDGNIVIEEVPVEPIEYLPQPEPPKEDPDSPKLKTGNKNTAPETQKTPETPKPQQEPKQEAVLPPPIPTRKKSKK